jgi:hypothetical protein
MLELISRVITRWSDTTNLILIACGFNASCRPRVGYVESETIRSADARLGEWNRHSRLDAAPGGASGPGAPTHAQLGTEKAEWQETATRSLAMSAAEVDKFMELERAKRIALDCARSVLDITGPGGRL